VVGEKEATNGTVNVRTRDNKVHGERSITDVIARFQQFRDNHTLDAEDTF
jgi:threonyl-tRNA synthetase